MSNALENMKLRAAYRLKDKSEEAAEYWEQHKKGIFPHQETTIIKHIEEENKNEKN